MRLVSSLTTDVHGLTRQVVDFGADGAMALLRFGDPGGRPLLFAHANGFCASAYRQMLARIGSGFDVHAVDLRGHGRTSLRADPAGHNSMDPFGADVDRLLTRLVEEDPARRPWRLCGHSLGAVSVLLAAARRSDIDAVRLIEPVAIPPLIAFAARTPFWPALAARLPLVRSARNRRSFWSTREAVAEVYRRKPLFSTWVAGALEDYLLDGLVDAEGGVRLACPPAWEAANFSAQAHDFWRAARSVRAPVRVLAARHPSTTLRGGAAPRLRQAGVEVRFMDGVSHLAPFERPDEAAAFLAEP